MLAQEGRALCKVCIERSHGALTKESASEGGGTRRDLEESAEPPMEFFGFRACLLVANPPKSQQRADEGLCETT
jgi:hypothetical protein